MYNKEALIKFSLIVPNLIGLAPLWGTGILCIYFFTNYDNGYRFLWRLDFQD